MLSHPLGRIELDVDEEAGILAEITGHNVTKHTRQKKYLRLWI
jgi:hypothetical protein